MRSFVASILVYLINFSYCDELRATNGADEIIKTAPLTTEAKSRLGGDPSKYFFNVSNSGDYLALFSSAGPLRIELATVTKKGIESFKPKVFYEMTGQNNVTGTRSDDIISLVMKYSDSETGENFTVSEAEIKMDIQTGASFRPDYWLLKTASISLTYTTKSGTQKQTIDLTPRLGYTSNPADLACGTGYSLCAPHALTWTCTDQIFKKVNLTELSVGSETVILHMPGMKLQPFKKDAKNIKFGYRWDCDPLIPLSLWVSILLTLGLAAIVWWALAMLSAIFSPSKFDDPKGPSIFVPLSD